MEEVRVRLKYKDSDRAWKVGRSVDDAHKKAKVNVKEGDVDITYPDTEEGRLLAQGVANAAREEGTLVEITP